MSRQFFAAVAILAFVLIALTVVIVIEPIPLRSMPLPRVYPPVKYQFATSLFYEGVQSNMAAVIETDGTTISLAYPLTTDPDDPSTSLRDPEWVRGGDNLIYTEYIKSDKHSHIVMLDTSAIPPYGSEDYPVDGVEYLLKENIPPIQITPNDGLNHFEPVFSYTNSKIAYLADAPGHKADVYTINLDGTEVTQITNTPDIYENQVSWSPDGTMLAYIADIDERPQIYIVPATGGEPTQLTFGSNKYHPLWAWSGERIYYVAHPIGSGIAWIQSISLSGDDIHTHYTAVPTTLGATASIDSLVLGPNERTLGFIKVEQLHKRPDVPERDLGQFSDMVSYISTLHFLDPYSGEITSPVWEGELQPMIGGLKWRYYVPGVEPPLF